VSFKPTEKRAARGLYPVDTLKLVLDMEKMGPGGDPEYANRYRV
jgi:hypothetical protein